MELTLSIDQESCIKCGKCVKACPSRIIKQRSNNEPAFVESTKGCISCGHCVAVCPSGAVLHSAFPAEKVHPVDYADYPSADQLMLLLKARRSNRVFSNRAIPATSLDLILEAAHRAPTASNQQKIAFTLITDAELLRKVSEFTIGEFHSAAKKLDNPILKPFLKKILPDAYRYLSTFKRMKREFENGNDLVLRKATALLLIHTPKSNRFGCEDANLAYQNGSLMAEALGVSQFYTGFVCIANKLNKKEALAKLLGIEGTIHSGMALGMPLFRYPNYIDRKEIVVNKL